MLDFALGSCGRDTNCHFIMQFYLGRYMVEKPNMLPEFTKWPTKGYSNLEKIFILRAGLFTNSFLLPVPVVVYWFTLCQLGVGFGLGSHARHLNRHFHLAIFSGLMCGRQTHMPPEPHIRIHEFVDKWVPQSQEIFYCRSWFVHEIFPSCLSSILV